MHNSKLLSIIGLIAAIVGALSVPSVLNLLPATVGTVLIIVGAIAAALGKGLAAPSN